MKEIPLTRGKVAIVDDEDYETLAQFKWCAVPNFNTWYAVRTVRNKETGRKINLIMHRLITNAPVELEVDHINGDGLNNKRDNLRLATRAQNTQNQKKKRHHGGVLTASIYKGVTKTRTKNKTAKTRNWEANIKMRISETQKCKAIHLGSFWTEEEAAKAYDQKAIEVFGQFARLNFPLSSNQPSAANHSKE